MNESAGAARDYTAYWSDLTPSHANHPGNRFRYGLILEEINRRGPARRVVDCGCGDGSLLDAVCAAAPYEQAVGMDVAANAPANRTGARYQFQQQDLGVPVSDELREKFDLVLCSEVIEHVQDDEAVIANLAALTSPGGTAILTTQSGRIYKTESYLGHIRHYSLPDLAARVTRHGLVVKRAYVCGWPWLNLQKIAAHTCQGAVQKQIVQARELGAHVKILFVVLRYLYRLSSRSSGPQIVIVAEKPTGRAA